VKEGRVKREKGAKEKTVFIGAGGPANE